MTHRVVRGALLACGRPDGRLMALISAEASVCLSVNQASSIQSIGSTCESMTIGHNPSALGLAAHNLFLPGCCKRFLCENVLVGANGKKVLEGTSVAALLGAYSNLRRLHSHAGSRKPEKVKRAPRYDKNMHVQADMVNIDASVRSGYDTSMRSTSMRSTSMRSGPLDASMHNLFSANDSVPGLHDDVYNGDGDEDLIFFC